VKVTVLTGIFGDYDGLKEQPPQLSMHGVEFVCVTDNPHLHSTPTWQVELQPRGDLMHPRLAAKIPKVDPWRWVDIDRDFIVWMDGSFVLKDEHAIARLLDVVATDATDPDSVWQFTHPARDCIYTEAYFSVPLLKYHTQPVADQAAYYRKLEHPEHWGLWATGFIVYPRWSPTREYIGHAWLAEQVRWTNQDQVSQAVVWRDHNDRPRDLPGQLLINDFVTLHPHVDGT
jgi:hypothetical protein